MLIWSSGGVRSVCHRYMCILLYVKLMRSNGVAYIYAQLEEGDGVSVQWVHVHSSIGETLWV